ncbi:MAG TPA: twin-arginine translocase TatA/TatE family subunit [Psychromonas hadalis]|nr:twin-arginine translocase TatA/TatE family subunit [Psychromonas hadalis]
MGGISVWQLAIIAVIVILLFGTKKLRGIGGDLGGAVKGFKKAMSDDDSAKEKTESKSAEKSTVEDKSDANFSDANKETVKEKEKA